MDGFLLVDKPAGLTSHDVVDVVRRVAKTRRVGHAGTLDPFATGLLILGINQATKALTGLVGLDKTYEATLELGATSETFDVEGVITPVILNGVRRNEGSHSESERNEILRQTQNDRPTDADIERALDQFRGGYEQKAPLHSAKKIKGKKLYELARAGQATEEMRPVKHVSIPTLLVTRYLYPDLDLRIACSSGTYIRSLADDIGRALGVGAYCKELRRTSIGAFSVKDALTLNGLTEEKITQTLLPIPAVDKAPKG